MTTAREPPWCPRCWSAVGVEREVCLACEHARPDSGWLDEGAAFPPEPGYTLVRQLTCGETTAVFLCRDSKGQEHALKVLRNLPSQPSAVRECVEQQFEWECSALMQLRRHSRYFPTAEKMEPGSHVVMKWISAPTLDHKYMRGTRSYRDAVLVALELLAGLKEVHKQRIVHRDLKPSNLFIEGLDQGTPSVRIADFGSCLFLDQSSPLPGPSIHDATGTPDYMSPEQMDDPNRVDARSDLHAVATIVWELVTGELPYPLPPDKSGDAQLVARRAALKRPPPNHQKVPEGLSKILKRALAHSPRERYANCEEFIRALRQFDEDQSRSAEAQKEETQRRVEEYQARAQRLIERVQPVVELYERSKDVLSNLERHSGLLSLPGDKTIQTARVSLDKIKLNLEKFETQVDRWALPGEVDGSLALVKREGPSREIVRVGEPVGLDVRREPPTPPPAAKEATLARGAYLALGLVAITLVGAVGYYAGRERDGGSARPPAAVKRDASVPVSPAPRRVEDAAVDVAIDVGSMRDAGTVLDVSAEDARDASLDADAGRDGYTDADATRDARIDAGVVRGVWMRSVRRDSGSWTQPDASGTQWLDSASISGDDFFRGQPFHYPAPTRAVAPRGAQGHSP